MGSNNPDHALLREIHAALLEALPTQHALDMATRFGLHLNRAAGIVRHAPAERPEICGVQRRTWAPSALPRALPHVVGEGSPVGENA